MKCEKCGHELPYGARICPNCGNKIYPELVEEEYFYNCVCQSCNHILFPLFGLYGNKINHVVITKIEE